tara:strand:- start:41253 stop:41615 length:363 start_codon:yes stop_codon:yes gene_type:complete
MTVKIDHVVLSTVISAVLGFLAAYLYLQPQLNAVKDDVALRPPVIVVDMAKLALDSVPVGSPKEDIKRHFARTQEAINKFKEAGFLVIPRENIISAPEDLMLSKDDVSVGATGGDAESEE